MKLFCAQVAVGTDITHLILFASHVIMLDARAPELVIVTTVCLKDMDPCVSMIAHPTVYHARVLTTALSVCQERMASRVRTHTVASRPLTPALNNVPKVTILNLTTLVENAETGAVRAWILTRVLNVGKRITGVRSVRKIVGTVMETVAEQTVAH